MLACEVLWRVNQHDRAEPGKDSAGADWRSCASSFIKREMATLLDRKLLYDEFRRNVPAENLPRIEENLLEPFQEHEMPELMKQLKVNNQLELERELTRLGSSLADVRQVVQRTRDRQRVDSLEGEDQRRSQPGRDAASTIRRTWPTTSIRRKPAGKS